MDPSDWYSDSALVIIWRVWVNVSYESTGIDNIINNNNDSINDDNKDNTNDKNDDNNNNNNINNNDNNNAQNLWAYFGGFTEPDEQMCVV